MGVAELLMGVAELAEQSNKVQQSFESVHGYIDQMLDVANNQMKMAQTIDEKVATIKEDAEAVITRSYKNIKIGEKLMGHAADIQNILSNVQQKNIFYEDT